MLPTLATIDGLYLVLGSFILDFFVFAFPDLPGPNNHHFFGGFGGGGTMLGDGLGEGEGLGLIEGER